ncbi:MAG: TM2 domain-containing protein [Lachnospira sp.]|nr:TM2 domain-containing protein [Lachnospira sp.]
MFCKNCGKEVNPGAAVCTSCGVQVGGGMNFCQNCGNQTAPGAAVCTNCGMGLGNGPQPNMGYQQPNMGYNPQYQNPNAKSKMAAGLLGIFLGAYGIHNFYLGNTGRGIAQIIVTLVTCGVGSLWGLIEGILILCGSINTDADGNPLV